MSDPTQEHPVAAEGTPKGKQCAADRLNIPSSVVHASGFAPGDKAFVVDEDPAGTVPKPCLVLLKEQPPKFLSDYAVAKGSRVPLFKYYKYLMEHLCFPFIAHFPKPMNTEEEDEFCCTVLNLLDPAGQLGDELDGIFCKTRKEEYESNLPLIDLYLPEDNFGFQLIDDYWYWFWNWR